MKFSGERLRTAIDDSDMPAVDVAEKAGVSKSALYQYIGGMVPSADVLARLAGVLGRDLEFFYSDRADDCTA